MRNDLYSKYTIAIAVISFIIGAGVGAVLHTKTIVVRPNIADTPAALTSVDLMIDTGTGTVRTWNTISWHEAMSVLDLLQLVADTKNITLETKEADGKTIVSSIDGTANAAKNGMRWQYWVDNNYEPNIPGKYYLKPGDIVIWKYADEQRAK